MKDFVGHKRDTLLGAGQEGADLEVTLGGTYRLDERHPEVGRAVRAGSLAEKVDLEPSTSLEQKEQDLTVAQIKERLEALGVEYDPKVKKAELLELLRKHEGMRKAHSGHAANLGGMNG